MQSSFDITGTSTSCSIHDGLPSSFNVPHPVTIALTLTYNSSVDACEIEKKKKIPQFIEYIEYVSRNIIITYIRNNVNLL